MNPVETTIAGATIAVQCVAFALMFAFSLVIASRTVSAAVRFWHVAAGRRAARRNRARGRYVNANAWQR